MHLGWSSIFIPIFGGLRQSVIDVVLKYRLRSKNVMAKEVDTNDKRVFIYQNGPPCGYKGTRSFVGEAL